MGEPVVGPARAREEFRALCRESGANEQSGHAWMVETACTEFREALELNTALRARVAELERRNAAMVDWIYRAGFEYASTSKAFHGMSPSIGGAMDVLSESDIESARTRAEGRKQG